MGVAGAAAGVAGAAAGVAGAAAGVAGAGVSSSTCAGEAVSTFFVFNSLFVCCSRAVILRAISDRSLVRTKPSGACGGGW